MAKGYEGTSTRELTEHTGLTQSSIYAAFGDKRGFFLRCLDQYLDRTLRDRIARLETSMSPGRAIAAFFGEVVDRSLADSRHRGCLLVNTALEVTPENPAVQRFVADETLLIERFFQRCVLAGQRSGEILADCTANDHARHLLAVMLGLRVLARIRPDSELLMGLVSTALTTLGISCQPRERKAP